VKTRTFVAHSDAAEISSWGPRFSSFSTRSLMRRTTERIIPIVSKACTANPMILLRPCISRAWVITVGISRSSTREGNAHLGPTIRCAGRA